MIMIINMVIGHHQILWRKVDDPGLYLQVFVVIMIISMVIIVMTMIINMAIVIIKLSWPPSS